MEKGEHILLKSALEKINAPSRENFFQSCDQRDVPNDAARMFPADVLMVLPDKSELWGQNASAKGESDNLSFKLT